MLIFSMTVSVDGFVSDRDGRLDWSVPIPEVFDVHLARVRGLSGYLMGRRLYEAMLPWEHDPSMRTTAAQAEFADVWTALPKVVFSRTLDSVRGHARLARGTLADEVAAAVGTDRDVEIGGVDLAGQAVRLGLVDEFRIFRYPIVLGGGTPYLPPVADPVPLDLVETRTFGSRMIYERYRRAEAASSTA